MDSENVFLQGVSLVMIHQREAIAKRKIGETSVNVSEAQRQLIGIGQANLGAIVDPWRMQRQFPTVDARSRNGDRKK